MTTLNVTFVNNSDTPRFPVYSKYPMQHLAQPAYIYLDLRDGECGADYNAEMGSTPVDQWHNIVVTFPISAETKADEIESFIESAKEDLQAILDDSEVEWNGNNHVGVFGETAKSLIESLTNQCTELSHETIMINDDYFGEWLQDNIFPDANKTPEEFAQELLELDGENGAYFTDDMNSDNAILSSLTHIWAETLYSGRELPKHIAQYLLDNDCCVDSAWMEELNEFAAQ